MENSFCICYKTGPVNVSPAGHQSQVTRDVLWTGATQTRAPEVCMSSFLGDAGNLEWGRQRGQEQCTQASRCQIRSLSFRRKP